MAYLIPFDPDESPLTRAMARGHLARTGHVLMGNWSRTGYVRELKRVCCSD